MIKRTSRTILLLCDEYPGYNYEEARFIEDTLSNAGYYVKKITVEDILIMGGNFACMYAHILIVPNCKNVPLEIKSALKIYNECMGSILYIGGPLFYNLVEKNNNGENVKVALDNTLDANFASKHPYVREGVAPSYKTFMAHNISRLQYSSTQNFVSGEISLPAESSIVTPCEIFHGIGFNTESNCRFIPIVDCYEEYQSTDEVEKGLRNGCRGSLAFIELENTVGEGYIGKINYGMVENSQVGSAVASIGYNEGLQNLTGGENLLTGIIKKLSLGIYIYDGGAEGFRFLDNEDIVFGCTLMNTSDEFKKVKCVIEAEAGSENLLFEEEKILCPQSMSKIKFTKSFVELSKLGINYGKENTVSVKLYFEDKLIDWVDSFYAYEEFVTSNNKRDFVSTKDDLFILDGEPWYMAGINYWPTYSPSKEKRHYWMGMFDKANYDVLTIQNDLSYMHKLELNCVLIRVDFTDFDRVVHGLRDFIIRCQRYNIKIGFALTKATASKIYNPVAVEELLKKVNVANNPIVAFIDLEWESAGDHFRARTRAEFYDEWNEWIISKYGSIAEAERQLNVVFERDIYGNITMFDNEEIENPKFWADVYDFSAACVKKYWERLYPHLKTVFPNQLITFRFGDPYAPGYAQAAEYTDFSSPEIYEFSGLDDFSAPESRDNCVGLCVVSCIMQKYETGNKPIIWAEYGRSSCGIKWHNTLIYDHENQQYDSEELEKQVIYNKFVQEAMEEGKCAGSAPWWWCGGFRWTEMADFGYVSPSGKLTESGKNYVQFCRAMKEKIKTYKEDARDEYVIEADIYKYSKGKDAFVKEEGIPAYKLAKKENKKMVIKTQYNHY